MPIPQTSNRTKKELQSFRNHIEHIVDYNKAEFIFLLLQSGLCSQLTTLEVELSRDIDIGSAFVLLLKNAPAISTLKIIRALMLLENLEKIHSDLPLLETLVLKDVRIVSDHIPQDITPATTLRKLFFHEETPWSRLDPYWLQYICKKYPNISYLTLSTTPIDLNFWTEDEAKTFTASYIIPLLQGVGPQLKQLKINSNTLEPDLFEHMDQIGCQVKKLDVNNLYKTSTLVSLLKSNQYKHVHTLCLRDLLIFDFELLKELTSLKNLELYFRRNLTIVNLSDLLEMCPSMLESLLIDGSKLVSSPLTKQSFQIKKLAFGEPMFDDNISDFLSESCPDLNTLLLYNCGLVDITLKLPNTNLYSFEANQTRPEYLIAIQVIKTTGIKDSRFYLSDTKLPGVFNTEWGLDNVEPPKLTVIKSSEYSQPPLSVPFIKLECASLHNLIINRRVAY